MSFLKLPKQNLIRIIIHLTIKHRTVPEQDVNLAAVSFLTGRHFPEKVCLHFSESLRLECSESNEGAHLHMTLYSETAGAPAFPQPLV